jgi:hypothetical protein
MTTKWYTVQCGPTHFSHTADGCIHYANRNLPAVPVTYYCLTIESDQVRGVPIETKDLDLYEHEREVLLEPHLRFIPQLSRTTHENGEAITCMCRSVLEPHM